MRSKSSNRNGKGNAQCNMKMLNYVWNAAQIDITTINRIESSRVEFYSFAKHQAVNANTQTQISFIRPSDIEWAHAIHFHPVQLQIYFSFLLFLCLRLPLSNIFLFCKYSVWPNIVEPMSIWCARCARTRLSHNHRSLQTDCFNGLPSQHLCVWKA